MSSLKITAIYLILVGYLCNCLAAEISNSVEATNYFSGRENELNKLSESLAFYRTASIVGISGIGKTQLIRKYAEIKNYQIIWFFDCNRDLNTQYLLLAKYLNKNIEDKNFTITEEYTKVKEAVLDYLKPKKDWLLIFDNLKINQNHLIHDILQLETNGNIIIASQDATNLPNTIYLQPLKTTESIELINKILPNENDINHLNDLFKGYPLLIVQGLMLVKDNNSLIQDYKKILNEKDSSIRLHIKLALNILKPSAKELLYKILFINNQSFSKNLLERICNCKDKFASDLDSLIKLGLVTRITSSQAVELFEMHDVTREQIISFLDSKSIKNLVNNMIIKVSKSLPIPANDLYLTFLNDQTLLMNFEKLLFNAELYGVKKTRILNIREKLLSYYMFQRDFSKCEEMKDWLLKHQYSYWQLLFLSEKEKVLYASYLNRISMYEEWANKDYPAALALKNEAKDIIINIKGNYEYKFILFTQLAQSYVAIGDLNQADKALIFAEQFLQNKADNEMILFIKAKILLAQGLYDKALETINQVIELNKNIPLDTFTLPIFIVKAKILNNLQNYQAAYELLCKIYEKEKDNKQYSDLLIAILTELANAELGIGKIKDAYIHSKYARKLSLGRLNTDILLSQDGRLAAALKTEADCLSTLGSYRQAITLYAQAEAIFSNLYRQNMKGNAAMNDLYSNAIKAACKLQDKFWVDKFKLVYLNKFGLGSSKTIQIFNMQCF